MTTSALIDLIMTHTEELGGTDGDNTTLRAHILARAQQIYDKVWNFAQWDFKLFSGQVTITNGAGSLPADFADFGDNGSVFVTGQRKKLRYLEPRELFRRLNIEGATSTVADYFTVSNFDGTSFQRTITIYPTSSCTLDVYYNAVPPTLVDSTTSTNKLQALPAEYHSAVMVPGVQWLLSIDKGEGTVAQMDQWFEREMKRMKKNHVFGREQEQVMGQYGGPGAYRSW